jgi:hypothetical protein
MNCTVATRVLFYAVVSWLCVPEYYTEGVKVAGSSPIYAITGLLIAMSLCASTYQVVLRMPLFISAAVCTSVMLLKGLLAPDQYFSRPLLVYDLLIAGTFLAGLAIGRTWPAQEVRSLIVGSLCIALISAVVTSTGLVVGFVTAVAPGRPYTSSLLTSASLLLIGAPYAAEAYPRAGRGLFRSFGVFCSCVGLSVGLFSATRTLMIAGTLSLLVTSTLVVKGISRNRKLMLVGLTAGVLSFLVAQGDAIRLNNGALERLAGTDLNSEMRYKEVDYLLAAMEDQIWVGKGFGSMFVSPIVLLSGNLAAGPHIGLLTPFQKGGLMASIPLVIWPLLITAGAAFRRRRITSGFWVVTLYFIVASMSGGWHYLVMFVYAVALGQVLRPCDTAMRFCIIRTGAAVGQSGSVRRVASYHLEEPAPGRIRELQ